MRIWARRKRRGLDQEEWRQGDDREVELEGEEEKEKEESGKAKIETNRMAIGDSKTGLGREMRDPLILSFHVYSFVDFLSVCPFFFLLRASPLLSPPSLPTSLPSPFLYCSCSNPLLLPFLRSFLSFLKSLSSLFFASHPLTSLCTFLPRPSPFSAPRSRV